MTDTSPVAKLRRAALNLLARRDYSRHEMANKLLRKASQLQASVTEKKPHQGTRSKTRNTRPNNTPNSPAKQRQYDELGFDDENLEADLGIDSVQSSCSTGALAAAAETDTAAGTGISTGRGINGVNDARTHARTHAGGITGIAGIDTGADNDRHAEQGGDVDADECVDISVYVEPVLNWLTEHNFLNDHRFVDAYIRYGIGRGHGLMRIRQDLQRKGIEKMLLTDALEALETDWFELAADLRQRRFGASPPKSEQKERARQMRFLQYRGFNFDQCFYALSREPDHDHS